MATGYIGGGMNTTISYTPASPAKVVMNWSLTGTAAYISVNGVPVLCANATTSGSSTFYCAAGVLITFTSSSGAYMGLSALEEST
ncbi:hypothetical protein [Telmatospirillum sp.]|uniref:hypothetical protein n=1 Tax=Telmatospirillum sp. TaxID=2079197 RepID=UPI0028423DA0|nr:hypothetical protein [Telmatospirillum sp.]MDR3438938.1 hypothetical protein [Telmatospirillum sp.]